MFDIAGDTLQEFDRQNNFKYYPSAFNSLNFI